MLFMRLSRYYGSDFGMLPMADWPAAWQGLLSRTWTILAPQRWPLVLALLAATGLLSLAVPAVRRPPSKGLRAALALAAAAIVIGLFMGTRKHVQANLYMFRFLAPSLFFLQTACLALAVVPLQAVADVGRFRRWSLLASPLVLAAVCSHGLPSLQSVRKDLDQEHVPTATGVVPLAGIVTDDLLDARCTHVAGDYWMVWPAVYNANRRMHDRGESSTIWGVSLRSLPTQCYWSRVALENMRVAVLPGDPQALLYLRRYGFPPLVVVEKRATVWVLRPQVVVLGKDG
jgi:hypothetical protein